MEPSERPTGVIVLESPPALQDREGLGGLVTTALPLLGGLGSVVAVAGLAGRSGQGGRAFLAAGMFLLATIGFVVVQLDRQRQQRARQVGRTRADYLLHLGRARRHVDAAGQAQRAALTREHPPPQALPGLSGDPDRWVWPRPGGQLLARWGTRPQLLADELRVTAARQSGPVDPVCASALHRLVAVHRVQPDLPATLDLRRVGSIEPSGPGELCRALARALVCSAVAGHDAADLRVAVLADEPRLALWEWVKWLPHARVPTALDALGARRAVGSQPDALALLLTPGPARPPSPHPPHLLLVLDGVALPADHPLGAPDAPGRTVVDLTGRPGLAPSPDRVSLELDATVGPPGREGEVLVTLRSRGEEPVEGSADQCDPATAEALGRRLAGRPPRGGTDRTPAAADLLALLGVDDPRRSTWPRYRGPGRPLPPRTGTDRLRVPIGVGADGGPVHLDLKESAEHGMGPHGLVVGATGSGKSELLRTLVVGLAVTHPPEQLNLVLVDFKGGATFTGLAALPHVSALITNLADELGLVDRMQDALSGELVRRQELLRRAGPYASARDHDVARRAGRPDLEPLPSLVIVVDEFSELLSARPDFADLFVAIGRLGRSLGIHLLLASQRLDEGRLRGLESHLSFRIALRTFSATESRAVLGVPDAYDLPSEPGVAYLRSGPDRLVRFRAAYVSGADPEDHTGPSAGTRHAPVVLPFTATEVPRAHRPAERPGPSSDPTGVARSLVEATVARLAEVHEVKEVGPDTPDQADGGRAAPRRPRAHRIWLPPLDRPDSLSDLMPDLTVDPTLGLVSPRWREAGPLVLPVGVVDRPRDQRRDVLTLDLRGARGHLAVVGAPRTGKSTLLRTTVAALALTSTPRDTTVFALDLGGGALRVLDGLPHVAWVASRSEPDVVRRVVAEVRGILDRRETHFREHGLDAIDSYRRRRHAGGAGAPDDGYGELFLVVDGWGALGTDLEDLEPDLRVLASRGLALGLHLLVSATRWSDLRASARDLFGSRVELRLGDPMDSEVDRRTAAQVPALRPGRGLGQDGHHVLTALPRIDGRGDPGDPDDPDDPADPGDPAGGVEDLVRRIAEAWRGPAGPRLRLLPERVTLAEVRALAGAEPRRLLLGLDERDLAPVALDPDTDRHLVVLGDSGSGKTALLRTLVHELARTRTPAQAQLVVLDPRRSLLGEVPEAHLLHHLAGGRHAGPAIAELATYLERRLPGPDVPAAALRDRSWWTGADVHVLVDDLDLVSGPASPLAPLVPLLPQARDVGLHLVVARRVGGAARASYEPVLQTLRELASPGLLLAGSPEEGPLLGGLRASAAPPGRGRLVTRDRGVRTVQVAWQEGETCM